MKLPPGRFEITEPIVVSTGDTHLVGSGGATHIVNLNENVCSTSTERMSRRTTDCGE